MDMEDFLANFDDVDICNLTPDSLSDNTCKSWNTTVFAGSWVAGKTAGGGLQYGERQKLTLSFLILSKR